MLLRGYKPKPYVEKDARIVKIATRPGHRPVQASKHNGRVPDACHRGFRNTCFLRSLGHCYRKFLEPRNWPWASDAVVLVSKRASAAPTCGSHSPRHPRFQTTAAEKWKPGSDVQTGLCGAIAEQACGRKGKTTWIIIHQCGLVGSS